MSVKFISGRKKTRGELRLPQLHFVACDDWMKKLGKDAFCAWLEFYTWADRSHSDREADAIPNSMNSIVKKLGIGKGKFYNKIIRPLWNYGFIDLQDFEIEGNLKENPVNIIVYEYPQNDPTLATRPLIQIRDYDTEYKPEERKMKSDLSSSKIEPGSGSKIEPGSGSKIEPNNVLDINDLEFNVDDDELYIDSQIENNLPWAEEEKEKSTSTELAINHLHTWAKRNDLRDLELIHELELALLETNKDVPCVAIDRALEKTIKGFQEGKVTSIIGFFKADLKLQLKRVEMRKVGQVASNPKIEFSFYNWLEGTQ